MFLLCAAFLLCLTSQIRLFPQINVHLTFVNTPLQPFDINTLKGVNCVPAGTVSQAKLLKFHPDADLSVVCDAKNFGRQHLIVGRWHNMDTSPLSPKQVSDLLKSVLSVAGKQGWECVRSGGSNGKADVDKDFIKFLSSKAFPRRAEHIVPIQH